MIHGPELLLVGAVAAVGVLHTIVPDHWVPIALIGRQRGWSKAETARAALQAGTGHVVSTLLIAAAVWLAGVAFADRFGHLVDALSGVALIGFAGWIAVGAWRGVQPGDGHQQGHGHSHVTHTNGHSHDHHDSAGTANDAIHRQKFDHRHRIARHAFGGGVSGAADDPRSAPLRGESALITHHTHIHRHGRGVAHVHRHDHRRRATTRCSLGSLAPAVAPARHKTTGRPRCC